MIKTAFKCLLYLNSIIICQSQLEPFVVNGEISKIEDYPHSAYIEAFCGRKKTAICGSSILNQYILLTAAHCLPPKACSKRAHMIARCGSANKSSGIQVTATSYKAHEGYLEERVPYDIALVLLEMQLPLQINIGRVAISKAPVQDGQIASVAGWGYTNDDTKNKTFILQHTYQTIITRKECVKILGLLPEGVFCASDSRNISYPAGGDSGSALVINRFLQVGLVSYRLPSISRIIIVYTDVGYHYDWIKEHALKMFCQINVEDSDQINKSD